MIKYIQLALVRDHMQNIPSYTCPEGYTIRTYRPGDEYNWANIEMRSGEFPTEEKALARFLDFYGPYLQELPEHMFMLETNDGKAIGTATAWRGEWEGEERGRVSWVGIAREYHGLKLSKPLLSTVMQKLEQKYQKAYLTTQTTSYQAINLYLAFGFKPQLVRETCEEGWQLMEDVLQRKIL